DAVEVVTGLDGGLPLLVVAGVEASLDGAAQALEGRGGDDALGRATDAVEQVDAPAAPGGRDGAGDVAVGQEIDPRTHLPDPFHDFLVPGAVEDHHRHFSDRHPLGPGDVLDVGLDRLGEVDRRGGLPAGRDLLHV